MKYKNLCNNFTFSNVKIAPKSPENAGKCEVKLEHLNKLREYERQDLKFLSSIKFVCNTKLHYFIMWLLFFISIFHDVPRYIAARALTFTTSIDQRQHFIAIYCFYFFLIKLFTIFYILNFSQVKRKCQIIFITPLEWI